MPRDYESNDLAGAAYLAWMDEDIPPERPEPYEYRDLDPRVAAAEQRAAQAKARKDGKR